MAGVHKTAQPLSYACSLTEHHQATDGQPPDHVGSEAPMAGYALAAPCSIRESFGDTQPR